MVTVAVGKGRRDKRRMAEMKRREYEDEALRVTMVGHVRAPAAAAVRTSPEMEEEKCLEKLMQPFIKTMFSLR
ncbi:hypothetical protein AXF42_Ash007673 [Apostasia shenzhenica]|uniref:Uncharacterized protein n=1 Tax=Apostasia shenzhenica TaxID=1088818 RepID=A0A2I0A649_9ASPA|nr:hypothetical protein AXF42_Ash007673 [Apostasia shenzhenica]